MLAGQRQMMIVEEVRRHGSVRVSELTEQLGVSEMTVRRDLDLLAQSGLVEKVHGGATRRSRLSADEPGFEAKSYRQVAEKEAIARAASELVEPGQAVALSAGTTTWRLAQAPAPHAEPDGRHELAAGRRRPPCREEARPDRRPHGRRPDTLRRARRPDRGGDAPFAPRRRALHGRARDERGRGLHDPEPARGRDRRGADHVCGTARRRRRPHQVGSPRPRQHRAARRRRRPDLRRRPVAGRPVDPLGVDRRGRRSRPSAAVVRAWQSTSSR